MGVLRSVRRTTAAGSAGLRAVHGVVFLGAIAQLAAALDVLSSAPSVTAPVEVDL